MSRSLELPGSKTTSVTACTPLNDAVTATREQVGAADRALGLTNTPMKPDAGLLPPQQMPSPETPEAPEALPTKIRLALVGSTAMRLIAVPASAWPLFAAVPVPATRVSNGPFTTGVLSALLMRYRPTP